MLRCTSITMGHNRATIHPPTAQHQTCFTPFTNTNTHTMSARALYATLIGINAYPKNPLNGCVHDILSVDHFLRNLCIQQDGAALTYHPAYFLAPSPGDVPALDSHACQHDDFTPAAILEPTFNNVTTKAFDHLKSAKDGDICLLYYSGHGSTIEAPEAFRGDKSKLQNETIVCVDSRSGARDLIDKEIAFLLWDALKDKNVHCLVVMDCCFAGNNTRTAESDDIIGYRHLSDTCHLLPLQGYLGYDYGFFKKRPNGGVDFPIGKYVQLAASMDNQTAQETASEGGLFTSRLVDALRKGGGARSYRDLMQTVRVSVRNRNPNQTPVGFAAADTDLDALFLGGDIAPYKPTFEVRFDQNLHQWKLFGGAMDGIVSTPANKTRVNIVGTEKHFDIETVYSNFSILDALPGDLDAETGGAFQAVITKFGAPLLEVCLSDGILEDAPRLQALQAAYNNGSGFPYTTLLFEKEKRDAPYQARLTDAGEWVLVRTGSTIPLFKRSRNPTTFLQNVNAIGKWMVASNLNEADTTFSKTDFTFRLERIEGKKLTATNLDTVPGTLVNEDGYLPEETVMQYKNNMQPAFRLQIGIRKDAPHLRACYVGAIYLTSKYGILTELIRPDAQRLEKDGEPVSLKYYKDGSAFITIPLSIDTKYHRYGINEITAQLKIIVSKEPLHLDHFKQDCLELDDSSRKGGDFRGEIGLEEDDEDRNDWCVFSTRIRIIGPRKSSVVQPGTTTNFAAFQLQAPDGFEAIAYAATGDDIIRSVAVARQSKSAQPTHAIIPPAGLFGNANTLDQAFACGMRGSENNGVQVLELRASEQTKTVVLPPGKELLIKPKTAIGTWETIVPYGYDEASGLYFPVGYTDGEGVVHIDQLPPSSEGFLEDLDAAEKKRSLGGSIKLFFQKVVWSRLTGVHHYNRLTLHQRGDDGIITPITYFGTPQTKAEAAQIAGTLSGGRTLLLIHGIIGDTEAMVQAFFESEDLLRPFDHVLSFDYENLHTGIQKSAEILKKMLIDCGLGQDNRVTIVAHSMGGLVSRYLIEHLDGHLLVDELIQCGTPNSGSELAEFRRMVTGWMLAGLNGIALFKPYMGAASFFFKRIGAAIFHTLEQMDPDSSFLANLNKTDKPKPPIPYHLIGGDTSNIGQTHPEDASRLKTIWQTLTSRGLYTGLDRIVFDKNPNDMAVKVARMKDLPWGSHQQDIVLDCDHMRYFSDPKSVETLARWVNR